MKTIRLSTPHFIAFVSDEDYDRVQRIPWQLFRNTGGGLYAIHFSKMGKSGTQMHRFILRAKPGEICDHKDGNGLNNTRENIHIVSQSENLINTKRRREGKCSAPPYISLNSRSGRYEVRVKGKYYGSYRTLKAAIEVRDRRVR